jgi:hypothetical protein
VTTLEEALKQYAEYQLAYNVPRYAQTSIKRVTEFVRLCKDQGVVSLEAVQPKHIRAYLSCVSKEAQPGAWRQLYIAVQVFFN